MHRIAAPLAALLLAAGLAGCGSSTPAPAGPGGSVIGTLRLVGRSDASGATVTIDTAGPSATTDAQGRFIISGVAEGLHTLRVTAGEYEEIVPAVFVVPGAEALLLDDGFAPLPTFEVPRARRLTISQAGEGFGFGALPDAAIYLADVDADVGAGRLEAVTAAGTRTTLAPVALYATASPDGSRIAFQANGCVPGGPGCVSSIRVGSIDGSSSVEVGTGDDLFPSFGSVGFSRDGTRLVVASPSSFRVVATGDGTVLEAQAGTPLALSPDGARILWVDTGHLMTKPVGSGAAVEVSADVCRAQFTPDGARILREANCLPGTSDLWSAPAAGGSARLLVTGMTAFSLQLAAGGATVVYQVGSRLESIGVAAGAPVPLADHVAFRPTVSPDGTKVAYVHDLAGQDGALSVVDVAGGTPVPLEAGAARGGWPLDRFNRSAIFTADSSRVLFAASPCGQDACTVKSVAVTGGAAATLGDGVTDLLLQPGGALVAFLDGYDGSTYSGRLRVAGADGSGARTVAEDVRLGSAAFSPDGGKVAFVGLSPEERYLPFLSQVGTLATTPAAGGPVTARLGRTSEATWTGSGALVAIREGTAAPLRFQNGVYRVAVP